MPTWTKRWLITKSWLKEMENMLKNSKILKSEISFLIPIFNFITNRDYILIHTEFFTQITTRHHPGNPSDSPPSFSTFFTIWHYVPFGVYYILHYFRLTIFTIWHYVLFGIYYILIIFGWQFLPFDIMSHSVFIIFYIISGWQFLPFDIMSYSAFIIFNITSSQNFLLFDVVSRSAFSTFILLSFHHFLPFDLLSFQRFFFTIQPFFCWPFVPFDVVYVDIFYRQHFYFDILLANL